MFTKGHIPSKEHLKNLSISHLGQLGFWKGKKLSKEHKHKLSLAKIGKKRFPHTLETIQKMKLAQIGKKNYQWKGDRVGYSSLHKWVYKNLGKAIKCEFCRVEKTVPRSIQWSNKSHKYKRKLTDWIYLCVSCHKKYDIEYKRSLIK